MGRLALWIGGLALGLGACAAKAPIGSLPKGESVAMRLVIDVRDPKPFAAGHLPGALNIQLGWGQLAARTRSYVPDLERALAVRAESISDAERASAILGELGYKDFVRVEPTPAEETSTLGLISAVDLARELAAPDQALVILDIRTGDEFADGVIEGAMQIDEDAGPMAVRDLDPNGHYRVICAGGYRSSQLATWMHNHGFTDVTNVIDGMSAWYEMD